MQNEFQDAACGSPVSLPPPPTVSSKLGLPFVPGTGSLCPQAQERSSSAGTAPQPQEMSSSEMTWSRQGSWPMHSPHRVAGRVRATWEERRPGSQPTAGSFVPCGAVNFPGWGLHHEWHCGNTDVFLSVIRESISDDVPN